MDLYDRYTWAQEQFARRDHRGAATTLEAVMVEAALDDAVGHGLLDARLLLARSYYHSAQLRRAEETLRAVLAEEPQHDYAALLLARTLERAGRPDEARQALARATALGAPGT